MNTLVVFTVEYFNLSPQLQFCSAAALSSLKHVLMTFWEAVTDAHSGPSCSGPGKDAVMPKLCVSLTQHDLCTSHPASRQCWGSVSRCLFLWCQPWHSVTLLPQRDAPQIMSWPLSWSVCFRCSLCRVLCLFLSLFSLLPFISPSSILLITNISLPR